MKKHTHVFGITHETRNVAMFHVSGYYGAAQERKLYISSYLYPRRDPVRSSNGPVNAGFNVFGGDNKQGSIGFGTNNLAPHIHIII